MKRRAFLGRLAAAITAGGVAPTLLAPEPARATVGLLGMVESSPSLDGIASLEHEGWRQREIRRQIEYQGKAKLNEIWARCQADIARGLELEAEENPYLVLWGER